MNRQLFGMLVTAALTNLAATAHGEGSKQPAAKVPAKTCVHNCAGYSNCKGNGNNACKGKNGCANEGLVPKECSGMKDAAACGKVMDPKNQAMCTWQ